MILRPYQTDAFNAVIDFFRRHSSLLVEAATGTGKTVLFAHLARVATGRVMVVAHRDELIRQAADKIHAITGTMPAIEMGDERVEEQQTFLGGRPKVIVTSVQTMCRANRHGKFNPEEFSLLIIDEAHHAVASTYRTVINHFRQNAACKVLGVTATPKRADDFALGQVFEAVAYQYGIEAAVDDGWLVPVSQQVVKVDGLDFSAVRNVGDDFNAADLESVINEEKMIHKVVAPTMDLAGDRSTLVFCVSVSHAEETAKIINRYKQKSAIAMSGKTDPTLRKEAVAAFKEGAIQFLCNCNLYLEGFDAPNTAVVVMARPTKSIVLYAQVLGRGTRPLPGVVDDPKLNTPELRRAAIAASAKPGMVVVDFVGNAGKHKIIQAADVLGGKRGAPVREMAKRLAEEQEGQAVSVEKALDQADAYLDFMEEHEQWRRAVKAKAEYRTIEVSPFGGGSAGPAVMNQAPPRGSAASEAQVNLLCKLGVSRAAAMRYTKRQASAVIDDLMAKKGWNRNGRGR